jgi:hypothetical protein
VAIERGLIAPKLFDVDQAGVKHIFGITVFDATFFGTTGIDHAPHGRSRRREIAGRETNRSEDKQHGSSLQPNKQADSPTRPGASKAWLKIKNRSHPALMRVAKAFVR